MEILIGIGIFMAAIALLSLGTVLFRRPIHGSCGGASRLLGRLGGGSCHCGRTSGPCPEKEKEASG